MNHCIWMIIKYAEFYTILLLDLAENKIIYNILYYNYS